jgi:hypothetical protein
MAPMLAALAPRDRAAVAIDADDAPLPRAS